MSGISAGDILFIVLVGGLVVGLMWLANRGRRKKMGVDATPHA